MVVLSKTEAYILNVSSVATIVSFSQLPAKVSGFLQLPDKWPNALTMDRKDSQILLSIPNSKVLLDFCLLFRCLSCNFQKESERRRFLQLCWCLEISLLCPVWNNCYMSKNDQLDGCLLLSNWGIVDLHNFFISLWDHFKHLLLAEVYKDTLKPHWDFFPLSNTGWNCSNSKLFWGRNQTNTDIHAPKSSSYKSFLFLGNCAKMVFP